MARLHAAETYVGTKFGALTVVSVAGKDKHRHVILMCRCDCGADYKVLVQAMLNGTTTSCGCITKERKGEYRQIKQLEKLEEKKSAKEKAFSILDDSLQQFMGKKYGKLIVVGIEHGKYTNSAKLVCKCDCGNFCTAETYILERGLKKSCGCLAKIKRKTDNMGLSLLYTQYLSRAKIYNRVFDITLEDFQKKTTDSCHYCKTPPSNSITSYGDTYNYNGLDRIDSSFGYSYDNVVTCCTKCNTMKMEHSAEKFIEHVEIIWKHWASK